MLKKVDVNKKIFVSDLFPGDIDETVEKILYLERECFPLEWQDLDRESYYTALKDKKNIHIFLFSGKAIVGYALFVPLKYYLEEIKVADGGLSLREENEYYLDTIQILKEFRGMGGLELILESAIKKLKEEGVGYLSLHARKVNKFNEKIKGIFKNLVEEDRNIKKWSFAGGEPYNFLRIKIS